MRHFSWERSAGPLAAAASVKTLVLSHLVPAEYGRLTDQMWVDLASVHFKGQIIVAKDLMEI